MKRRADERATTGPSQSTRSQNQGKHVRKVKKENKFAGRVYEMNTSTNCSLINVTFSAGMRVSPRKRRAEDGSNDLIVSSQIAELAVLNGIGRVSKIQPVWLQVAIIIGADDEAFTFSRTWTLPRTVLKLSAGPLVLLCLKYHVADSDLAAEELFISLLVLQFLGIDTKTILEERRDLLDDSDRSTVITNERNGKSGCVS